ncbi:hypothetical protein [Nocardia sp. NBC_00511]|uniref:hypothetical protein n=1 Tax=Nocardia sp. NBC_00511 TaxID=2903591 RepID=UPI002F90FE48
MSPSKADRASELHDKLVADYGENWSAHLLDTLHFDLDAPDVEVPRLGVSEEVPVTFTATLQLSPAAYQRLMQRVTESGADRDELLSEWVSAEASAEELEAISRDDILRMINRRHPRSA